MDVNLLRFCGGIIPGPQVWDQQATSSIGYATLVPALVLSLEGFKGPAGTNSTLQVHRNLAI